MSDLRDPRSDEQLMAAYVAGDQAAFELLFQRYAAVLYGLAMRRLGRDAEARDVVQQTLLQMHRARHDYRCAAPLRPWLITIAFNLVREQQRKQGRRRERSWEGDWALEEPSTNHDPQASEERAERAARLRKALASLPAQQREVIELHWFDESPYEEIARIVGASVAAVRVRAHRGYERLRELLPDLR